MNRDLKGILIYSKIHKDNDLFVKILSNSDEIITGIVYGGLSKRKRNILQIGFFLNIIVTSKANRPNIITAELTKPYISQILNDKFKLSCLLSTISIINLSIIEGQKVKNIFLLLEKFLNNMIKNKKWLIEYCNFLFNLLKIIGYEIDYDLKKKYFDLDNLIFVEQDTFSSIEFPHILFKNTNITKKDYDNISNFFTIFETIFLKNHLSNINQQLPNHYLYFKKIIINFLR